MCLVVFSWKDHPTYPLILSANRDEFFDRPTQVIHRWESGIIAGKDLRGGGTWMGFHPEGKWALLTNYRDFTRPQRAEISRGKLVQNFLEKEEDPVNYLERIFLIKDKYEGFNLLVSDGERLFYFSNYKNEIQEIQPGIHGLSNGLINDPWPKVELAKKQLSETISGEIEEDRLLTILKSQATHPLENLPKTGASETMEIGLSAQLIRLPPNYGTVSATAVIRDQRGKTAITERTFDWDPSIFSETRIHI
ncbi:NRDE family protein [Algoriphagus boritolerans]|uniref:Uncharacterized conserved protein, contains NRDE domain n=1 Tax=Algoriphagus boritolerans DSM 17298 = JCM 18970 TaxID=1120964 RepID=A0A1H5UFN6_9BACT|nr:NRDE family protein [Algoriphagus boritolerans]SEF73840.1 Uncharacterized conserved protein, contains NRDE domain [Algoriphagus boritolerans DSM 17298 = JCM 18970]